MTRAPRLAALLLLFCIAEVQAQPWTVEGRVYDAATRSPLHGASLTLEQREVPIAGTATDSLGYYTIAVSASGTYRLTARYVGYSTLAMDVDVSGDRVMLNFALEPTTVGLEEVEVSAGPFQPASDVSVAITKVSARTIRGLAGAGEDVLQALRLFPGVQTTGDYSTQLYIRGGTPASIFTRMRSFRSRVSTSKPASRR